MDTALDSHEDTTTTDYDSGDSGRVGYAYAGGKVTVCSKQLTKAASPPRKPKSRSPKGKPRIPTACYACGAPQSPPESDHDVNESTEFEEDTDVEGSVEHRCRPTRRQLSGPDEASVREEKDRGRDRSERSDSKKASTKRVARKRTPYIEEYPEDEARRPVILLKEHKLPRRFSASDAKCVARDSVEDRQDVGASSRGRSPTGKRLPASAANQGTPPRKQPATPPKRRRSDFQAVPGGTYSEWCFLRYAKLTISCRQVLRL